MNRQIKKGCIYLYDFGHTEGHNQNGFRPVLVRGNNNIIKYSADVLVVPITSVIKKPDWYAHVYIERKYGLNEPSMALFEQITSVSKKNLKRHIGTINDAQLLELIDQTTMKVLGLYTQHKRMNNKPHNDVRCFCKKHCEEYRLTSDFVLRRFNPYQVVKEKCDKCNNLGYDYLLIDKKEVFRNRGEKNA